LGFVVGVEERRPVREAVRAIEDFFARRYGRQALYLPSGRLALYLAFREWLRPGDRVLMSPVNDDVVFFTVLAAGLVPVLGPVDPGTGNIDPAAIDAATWTGLRAVLTTNLYGIPDRMDVLEERCERHGLLLIEDAAHAIDTRFNGRWIGEFGRVAAYSLTKHVGGVGGVLTFTDAGRRPALERRAAQEIRYRRLPIAIADRTRSLLSRVGASSRPRKWLARLRDRLVSRVPERSGCRLPYEATAVVQAQTEGGGLDRFEQWVRVDNHLYRTWPLRSNLRATQQRLLAFEDNRRRRLAGARKLLQLGLTPPDLPISADSAPFRVPLFVRERDKVVAHFARHGLALDYIYDPSLDVYGRALAEPLPAGPGAARWSRDVLPVDPLRADRFLTLLGESPGLCRPSVMLAD
jgi:DegT/DnrJ/EryC1/StrS aminotransferase family